MPKVIEFPALQKKLEQLRAKKKIIDWKDGKFKIIHQEVENLAKDYDIQTDINLVHCNLEKGCAVVKAGAKYNAKTFYSLGEVSPLNNDFP